MKTHRICPSCGANYDDTEPKCPYCGALNIKGAESEYLEKLEDVREDMEDLGAVPVQEARKEFRKQGSFIKKIFLALGGITLLFAGLTLFMTRESKVDAKAEYRWKQEVFPILDELYETGEFEKLVDTYWEYADDEMPLWDWEHADFCDYLDQCLYFETILEREKANKELAESDIVSLLYYGLSLTGIRSEELSEEELRNLTPYRKKVQEDFEKRWAFTETDMEIIAKEREKNYGNVSYKFCEDYVEQQED